MPHIVITGSGCCVAGPVMTAVALRTEEAKKARHCCRAFRISMAPTYDSACFTRSGENGTRRMRTPVASKIALAIAAATGRIAARRRPVGGNLRMVDQHEVDRLRRLGDVEDRIGHASRRWSRSCCRT